jgi:glycosyltransferase involved in cell wall biosynthesis
MMSGIPGNTASGSAGAVALAPFVSIVIPCRNEAGFIARCLDSIVANGYPKDRLEVLVVDGMSEDGTRQILSRYAQTYPFVRTVDNPKRTTPYAFNEGIRSSRGDLIMLMSAHATYEEHAIERSVNYSKTRGADNVGGIWKIVPRGDSRMARAVVQALSHPFGVGGARYRTGGLKEPVWADTAAYGCYRRDVFSRVGYFNEDLKHSQDMEFNRRLQKHGGRTLLAPDIEIYYFARTDFGHFIRHNFRNGQWAILPFCYSDVMPVSPRHLVPLAFVCALFGLTVASFVSPISRLMLWGVLAAYGASCLLASLSVWRRTSDIITALLAPAAFLSLHLSYGVGSAAGVIQAAWILSKKGRKSP